MPTDALGLAGTEDTVDDIQARATLIATYDGMRLDPFASLISRRRRWSRPA